MTSAVSKIDQAFIDLKLAIDSKASNDNVMGGGSIIISGTIMTNM
jgi:hypothetical protein